MEHRWSSDGSKDNPTRLNPPAAIPPTSLLSTPPHTCAILSRPMCPCLRENILRQACTDYEPRYRRLIPPFLWPFTARGWTSVGQEVGARQRHVLRATPPLEQPTRAALRVTCCHASRGGDVSTWLFCKLTSAITVARRRNWRRKTRQLNSQSVRNFFPILSDFFPPQLELEVSKIEASLETWKRGSWKFDLWWDGSFGGSFFWKFFWKENFFWRNIELKKYWWISNWSIWFLNKNFQVILLLKSISR